MLSNDTRKRIEYIVKGTILEGQRDNCETARNFLCASYSTSSTVKKDFDHQAVVKKEQASALIEFSINNNLLIEHLPVTGEMIAQGGEAKIFLHQDKRNVLKLNDGIYYATWLEFINSILLHNLLFEDTAYTLLGFTVIENTLMAVLKQPFIISDAPVNLDDVKKLLKYNGFENTRRNDYYNSSLGIILEDMHDENIIVNHQKHFFIDTVFYTVNTKHSS